MHRRGRSRLVSPVALARQASEERRHLTLEDQIQVAYAHDNIRLAKILLLRLKGVHVHGDDDPRIDQVRDEDFDMCFAPSGPLTIDEADQRALQRKRRSCHRAERLRACEKHWEDERSRLHAEKQRVRHEPPRPKTVQHRATKVAPRLETKRDQDPFQYAFMLPSKPPASTLPSKAHKKSTRSPGRRIVSFKDVVHAMNGQLFPLDACERADDARRIAGMPIPGSTSHRRKASMRAELLDNLLQVVEWQQGERRKAKGKDVVRDTPSPSPLPLVPSSLSTTSSSSSPSRSSSWLAFGSWQSTATDITTPDSPVLASPASSLPCLPTDVETQRDLHPRAAFVRISVEESPLCPSITPHPTSHDDDGPCVFPPALAAGSLGIRGALVKRVSRSVATLIEAAKGLQSAYITATMFSAGSPYMGAVTPPQPQRSMPCRHQARREGYRALPKDVRRFTDATSSDPSQTTEPVHFIPLVSQPSEKAGLPRSPVSKNALVFPSPLRPRTPPPELVYRMRPVANPAVLRLRALQNLMCARGKEWEGRAREGGLGCGKERIFGIAFEGRGRSGLGCEVRFVVA